MLLHTSKHMILSKYIKYSLRGTESKSCEGVEEQWRLPALRDVRK